MIATTLAWAIASSVEVPGTGGRWARTAVSSSGLRFPVFVGEADAAVDLGIAGEAFFDARRAYEDDSQGVAVVVVAHLFEAPLP
jgi:hypothetical protein